MSSTKQKLMSAWRKHLKKSAMKEMAMWRIIESIGGSENAGSMA